MLHYSDIQSDVLDLKNNNSYSLKESIHFHILSHLLINGSNKKKRTNTHKIEFNFRRIFFPFSQQSFSITPSNNILILKKKPLVTLFLNETINNTNEIDDYTTNVFFFMSIVKKFS
jgi:hypothetical protein